MSAKIPDLKGIKMVLHKEVQQKEFPGVSDLIPLDQNINKINQIKFHIIDNIVKEFTKTKSICRH